MCDENDERIKRLVDQAKTWYSTLTDFVFKHTAIQTVVLGWILSSQRLHETMENMQSVERFIPGILLISYSFLVFIIFRRLAKKSDYVFKEVKRIDESIYLEIWGYRIDKSFWLAMAVVHLALSIVSCYFLYFTKV
ncbi:hypothetical protein [Marinomonas sp. PE14-40]|uniref:hypothetical protein n=1 Tax=Marinomonas sp. PE14-40 TaxID=3060621 RepID=UPI003F672EED